MSDRDEQIPRQRTEIGEKETKKKKKKIKCHDRQMQHVPYSKSCASSLCDEDMYVVCNVAFQDQFKNSLSQWHTYIINKINKRRKLIKGKHSS